MSASNHAEVWHSYFAVMNGLEPHADDTIPKDWLKWIEPEPIDSAEREQISVEINRLIFVVKFHSAKGSELDSLLTCTKDVKSRLKRISAAINALQKLPEANSTTSQLASAQSELKRWTDLHEKALAVLSDRSSKKGKGRPKAVAKASLIEGITRLLQSRGKVASGGRTGTITGLARWIWLEVSGEDSTPDSWVTTLSRAGAQTGPGASE